MLLALLLACRPPTDVAIGDFVLTVVDGALAIDHVRHGQLVDDLQLAAGTGSANVETTFGAFRFTEVEADLTPQHELGQLPRRHDDDDVVLDILDAQGRLIGTLEIVASGADRLALSFEAASRGPAHEGRVELSAACRDEEHFLGLGSHAMDVDHVGQAFPLFVSEPGIGKAETEDEPPDWPVGGTRHASSYPVPWLLRPHVPHGLLVDTGARVEVDLCATDDRYRMRVWERDVAFELVAGASPLGVVETLTGITGRPALPPPWAFAPWNDAIRGPERVREVAATLREAGAPSSVIWTEDWKGARELPTGYRLEKEWFVDEELYPNAAGLDRELQDLGFKWFGYFSPFVAFDSVTGDDAEAAGVTIHDASGAPYRFLGVTFEEVTMIDLSAAPGRDWARGYLEDAIAVGFDGWMVDYAEWLPLDAVLASGEDAWFGHNRYPGWWQQVTADAFEGVDGTYFCRSGWVGTSGSCPIVWVGDQRTSFQTDDGLPTVVPLMLGLSASGIPVSTHDVAGYQSIGNDPSTQELWFRWAALGAFSPVMRTHHGAFDQENHQFDTNAETLDHWVAMAREHMRLWPYRYGLAAQAAKRGTPMVLPTSFRFDGEDWGRMDAWMLGEALLVAPVLEEGATSRDVDLPRGEWWDWWTLEPATSGPRSVPLTTIPVFAAAGTTVPTFATIPDTLTDASADLLTLDDVDGGRVVYLFGGGGPFTEADGTRYRVSGRSTGPGEATATLKGGTITAGGVTLTIDGPVERTYRVVTR